MKDLSHFNVLLAEDEPLLLRSLERHIKNANMGFKVVSKAQNGQEAIDLLQKNEIHLVITDIIMPMKSGLDLLKYVNENIPNTFIIVVSGYADFNYAQCALREKALDYLLKPITQEKIENVLMKAKLELNQHYKLIEDESLSGKTAEQTFHYVKSYLRSNYTQEVDLEGLAAQLGFSSSYITKIFNKYERCSPIHYLTKLRIIEAKNLLYNTHLSIKEVGERVGYPNQFYFSRVFRKMVQLSPSEYRQENPR